MPGEYDSQLMESVGVRRRRLRDAWLFGAGRTRQSMDSYVGKAFAGTALAAVVCAGCVGWSYLDRELAKEKQQQVPPPAVTRTVDPTGSPSPSGTASPTATPSPTASPTPSRRPTTTSPTATPSR